MVGVHESGVGSSAHLTVTLARPDVVAEQLHGSDVEPHWDLVGDVRWNTVFTADPEQEEITDRTEQGVSIIDGNCPAAHLIHELSGWGSGRPPVRRLDPTDHVVDWSAFREACGRGHGRIESGAMPHVPAIGCVHLDRPADSKDLCSRHDPDPLQ